MNKTKLYFIFLSIFASVMLIAFYITFVLIFIKSEEEKITAGIWMAIITITFHLSLFLAYWLNLKKREEIKKSFDYYIEEQISNSGTGVLIYNQEREIIWCSKFIQSRFGEKIIGQKLNDISKEFDKKLVEGVKNFRFRQNNFVFEVMINIDVKNVVLKDVTNEDMALKQYGNEKLVVGEVEIDNFAQFQSTLPEDEMFKAQTTIIKLLDTLSDHYNFIYKQYVVGKYIFFTNEITLTALRESDFAILDDVRKIKIAEWTNLTISIGIGSGTTDQKELQKLAKRGLTQAQARGGDQAAVMVKNKRAEYFGSKFEIGQISSRIKIKQIANLLAKRLSSPRIKNVIIYGHKMADLDAVGAAFGIAAIASAYRKPFFIGNTTFDLTSERMLEKSLTKVELAYFIRPSRATRLTTHNSIIVIVDTAELNRIENENALTKAKSENVFIFDHHRISSVPKSIPPANIYIDTLSSSTSEIVVEAINFVDRRIKIDKLTSQFLLNGIYLDTSNFTKSVSERTYQAASFLEKSGALSSESVEIMKYPEDAFYYIQKILENIREVKPGYFLASYDQAVPTDFISMAADEILRVKGRRAAFVVARSTTERSTFKMSARGFDTNVQKIAEAVGGGGHFASAAATSKEDLPIFIDNIRQAIVSEKGVK